MNTPGIKDVAKKANVSIGTVDRVVHNRGQVSEKTKQRVLEVIEELNYVPNTIASSLSSQKIYRIGVLLPTPVDINNYWHYPVEGIKRALREINTFNTELIESFYDINDPDDFNKKKEALISENPDGVIAAPVYAKELKAFLSVLNNKSIKYALIDSDLEDSKRSFFTGQNTYQSGRVAAQLLHYCLPANPKPILVCRIYSSIQGTPTIHQRENGFIEFFKAVNPSQRIYIESIEYQDEEVIPTLLQPILEDYEKYSAIFVPNSKSHLVVKNLPVSVSNKPLLIGYDLIEQNKVYLKDGKIDFLLSQRPISQGFKAVNALLKVLVEKKELNLIDDIPIDIITKENLSAYEHLNL